MRGRMNGLCFWLPSSLDKVWATILAAADNFLRRVLEEFDEVKICHPFISQLAYEHLEVQGDQ